MRRSVAQLLDLVAHLVDPLVLERLKGSKFLVRSAVAAAGVGDRRSRTIGPGVEFADYRDYQPGDDVRYVDRHVFARHGRAVIRQFHVDQQLRINVLLDATASMTSVDASKFQRARVLAACAAAVGVFGGDQVRVGAFRDGSIAWHPRLRNPTGLPRLFRWLSEARPSGDASLDAVARASAQATAPSDLLLVVSDWMLDGVEAALSRWSAARQDVVAVQVLAPEEVDPSAIGSGGLRLVDAESGDSMDVTLDASDLERYGRELRSWQSELAELVTRAGGRWSTHVSDQPLDETLFRAWRRAGLIT